MNRTMMAIVLWMTTLSACLPDCCEEYGKVNGKSNTCTIGSGNMCVGCDYEPVLCQTHGCGTANVKDCCLDDEGATVFCGDRASPHEPLESRCSPATTP